MRYDVPHPIPYQGSKRQLARVILSFVPQGKFHRMFEPFAGSAAITLAAANKNLCGSFVIADALAPLAAVWKQILATPQSLAKQYEVLWRSQLDDPRARFNEIRDQFNQDQDPAKLLFLVARCVKNAVRFNPSGQFNQSPDKRRLGVRPHVEAKEIAAAHRLLRGRTQAFCADFEDLLREARKDDLVYMDPPYQGTSDGRDRRYISGVERQRLIRVLDELNRRGVQFLLSYDGRSGEKEYGDALPTELRVHRVFIDAGRSSQATLNGKNLKTVESLYVSSGLSEHHKELPKA
jgi:DNA adenine methylase